MSDEREQVIRERAYASGRAKAVQKAGTSVIDRDADGHNIHARFDCAFLCRCLCGGVVVGMLAEPTGAGRAGCADCADCAGAVGRFADPRRTWTANSVGSSRMGAPPST